MLPADQSVVVVLANTVLRKLKFECWGGVFEFGQNGKMRHFLLIVDNNNNNNNNNDNKYTVYRIRRYTVCHALSCKKGGFVAQRHDGVRNLLTSLIGKVCTNVEVEPQLQPLDNERVLDVEMGFFTPLIFGTNGGMGADCNCFLKRLADREKLSEKNEEPYHITITCPSVCDNGVSSLI